MRGEYGFEYKLVSETKQYFWGKVGIAHFKKEWISEERFRPYLERMFHAEEAALELYLVDRKLASAFSATLHLSRLRCEMRSIDFWPKSLARTGTPGLKLVSTREFVATSARHGTHCHGDIRRSTLCEGPHWVAVSSRPRCSEHGPTCWTKVAGLGLMLHLREPTMIRFGIVLLYWKFSLARGS